MYRLLIVDDEHHVVDWLAELFREQTQLEMEIYKAYSANEALTVFNQVKVDVVLLDIKMPGTTGLELAEKIRNNWPNARIIFLTGYSEFDYIYMANKYPNTAYLLKTEDDDVILGTVASAIESLESELKNLELVKQSSSLQSMFYYQIEKDIILNAIKQRYNNLANICFDKDTVPIQFDFNKQVVILCVRMAQSQVHDVEYKKFILQLKKLTEFLIAGKAANTIIDMERDYYLWIIQPLSEETQAYQKVILYLKEMIDDFANACLEKLHCYAFFLLYEKPVPWNAVQEKYDFLVFTYETIAGIEALSYGGRVIGEKDETELEEISRPLIQNAEMKNQLFHLKNYLDRNDKKKFMEQFTVIADAMKHIKSKHFFPAIEVYQFISYMYLSYINRYCIAEKLSFKIGLYKLFSMYEFSSWEEAFIYLENIGILLFDEKETENMDKNSEFVELIKRYIWENIGGDLTLTHIAQAMNYNPSYVSRLFKQLSGMNLFDYINTRRLDYAKNLLNETSWTVQSIAQKAGFDSSQYFSTAFKKKFGMTPQEYRHQK